MIGPAFPTVRSFYRQSYAPDQLTEKAEGTKRVYEVVLNRLAKFFGGRTPTSTS